MRKAFNQELLKIAEKDPRVFMVLAGVNSSFPLMFASSLPVFTERTDSPKLTSGNSEST